VIGSPAHDMRVANLRVHRKLTQVASAHMRYDECMVSQISEAKSLRGRQAAAVYAAIIYMACKQVRSPAGHCDAPRRLVSPLAAHWSGLRKNLHSRPSTSGVALRPSRTICLNRYRNVCSITTARGCVSGRGVLTVAGKQPPHFQGGPCHRARGVQEGCCEMPHLHRQGP